MRSGKDASDAVASVGGRSAQEKLRLGIAESSDARGPHIPNRGRAAKANAFDAGNLEKLLRLRELLNEFQKHPFLRTHGHTLTS